MTRLIERRPLKKAVILNPRLEERNKLICRDYMSGIPVEEIGKKYNLSPTTIYSIFRGPGRDFTPDYEYERAQRIHQLKRIHGRLAGVLRKDRDEIDVIQELRKEIGGPDEDKSASSQVTNILAIIQQASIAATQARKVKTIPLIEKEDNDT